MALKLRILPMLLLVLLVLGLPAFAQDASQSVSETSADGWITYSATSCDYGGEISSIQAVDANTVTFTLCYPDPAFPSKVAFAAFQIQPSEYLESTGGTGELLTNPIGTGPWVFDHWDQGNEIVWTRNENYWGEPAKESQLIFRWNAESAARMTELQAGTVDGIDNPGALDFEVIAADPNLQLLPREGANVLYLGMNNTIAPFDNVLVRQAVAHAIDKQRLVDNFYPPGSSVATQFMPTSIFGFTEEVEPFPYDPARAMELLDESGVDLPITVELNYRDVVRGYIPQPSVIAADFQAQLNSIGDGAYFNVTPVPQESTTFLDNASAGNLALFLLGWGADYPDATNFLDFHFGSGANASFGDKFPEITEPLRQGAQLADPAERYPFYVEANTAIRDLVPMVPIAHGGSGVAFRAEITGANTGPLGNENFAVMEDPSDDNIVWYQNGEPGSLFCGDETDGESLRACMQSNESLLAYEVGGTLVEPSLAETWEASDDLLVWTFHLREGVTFHDGSALDANDVVTSYALQWDAAHPLHVGRTGNFDYWSGLFGAFLNVPPAE